MAETIALLNMKGGVGKTTLAFNLAWYLHKNQTANVLLIDLDPQFNATQCVMDFEKFEEHRSKKGTIADLLIDQPSLALRKKRNKKSPTAALYKVSETAGKRGGKRSCKRSLSLIRLFGFEGSYGQRFALEVYSSLLPLAFLLSAFLFSVPFLCFPAVLPFLFPTFCVVFHPPTPRAWPRNG